MNSLSVVVPTLNCAEAIPAHVDSMRAWADLAGEIIVVDSESDDGTPGLVSQGLSHPGLRILSHPRGLYQSWNHAIARTTGEWIYISTIGDTITREQLLHLLDCGTAKHADVVISPPDFLIASHIDMAPPVWPIARLLETYHIAAPAILPPCAAMADALFSVPAAILGSSASNLYRGDHLRARPFPTDYSGAGDTAWTLLHSLGTRFCLTPRRGSMFHIHSASYSKQDPDWWANLCDSLHSLGVKALDREIADGLRQHSDPVHRDLMENLRLFIKVRDITTTAQNDWAVARKASGVPWYFRPSAIGVRHKRGVCRRTAAKQKTKLMSALAAAFHLANP